jgi:hypothetical protein
MNNSRFCMAHDGLPFRRLTDKKRHEKLSAAFSA